MNVLSNASIRSPRQRYVWPDKALSLVRNTRLPKKEGAAVVKQLQEITNYPEAACWRLADKYGFLRPHPQREWSREDDERIIKMCQDGRSVVEIAAYFGTTVRTIYMKIIRYGKRVERGGSIYTVALICAVLRVSPATVRGWGREGRLVLKSELRGSATVHFAEDDEFERFCRVNHNYLLYEVGGGRVPPRERFLFLRQFVIAPAMADDHTARSHKREREAYAQQMKSEADDEDDEENDDPHDQA